LWLGDVVRAEARTYLRSNGKGSSGFLRDGKQKGEGKKQVPALRRMTNIWGRREIRRFWLRQNDGGGGGI
jgi:hypothetical protein